MKEAIGAARAAARSSLDRIANDLLVLGLRAAIRFAEWLGVDRTLVVGRALGRAWPVLGLPRTRRVREQLASAFPDEAPEQRKRWQREVFGHLAQGLAELVLMSGRHRAAMLSHVEVIGLEHLERAVRESGGKGAVVIGPHLGNWELAAAALAGLGVPVSAVYRGLRQPALERALQRVRSGTPRTRGEIERGSPIEQIAMGRRAGVQFLRALEAGRSVLVLLDQHARRDEGMIVEFFGRPARTRFGPLKLADRVGAPVLMAFATRDGDRRHHRLTIHPPLQLERGAAEDEEVLRRNLQTVSAAIETEIRALPTQWIWTHRRWRAENERRASS